MSGFPRLAAMAALSGILASAPLLAGDAVRVGRGSPIFGGRGRHPEDIQIENGRVAFTIAVKTPVSFGFPPGALVDASEVVGGRRVKDRVTLLDFVPNSWAAWKTTYQKITVEKNTPDEGAVRVERDWNDLRMVNVYSLRRGESVLRITTTLENPTSRTFADLLSGYILWTEGQPFGVPGLSGKSGPAAGRTADLTAAYGKDWVAALHASFFDRFDYEGRDLYLKHTLMPGESRSFEGALELLPGADLSRLLAFEIASRKLPSGLVQGRVRTSDGKPVARPFVKVIRAGSLYTFCAGQQGRYSLVLPEGEYQLRAAGESLGPGSPVTISVRAAETAQVDLSDLLAEARLDLSIRDQDGPVDARITLAEEESSHPRYLSKAVFFTELDRKGRVRLPLSPGSHALRVESGAPFVSKERRLTVVLRPGKREGKTVELTTEVRPAGQRFYCADLHHHSDQGDASTPPDVLVRSQLAARLDLLFVSDHDTTQSHAAVSRLARRRGVPFIPGIEISPSFGHFNAFPLRLGAKLGIHPASSTIQQIFQAARGMGAEVIMANHPTWSLGYFSNLEAGRVPGGNHPGYDLIELNLESGYLETIPRAYQQWNQGERRYLASGSDVHDAWSQVSGRIRTCARIPGKVTPASFARAVKSGASYVTLGPLVDPRPLPGETVTLGSTGPVELSFELFAVEGLKEARLVQEGKVIQTRVLSGEKQTAVKFQPQAVEDTWFALQAEDAQGNRLWTNPIWVKVEGK